MRPPADAIHSHEASIEIDASPTVIYDLVSDITRMGEWSPEASGGEWLNQGTGEVGDWFVGHNERPERRWSRECEVACADPGKDFTFVVLGVEANCTWWSYEIEAGPEGTKVTERWWMVNLTPAMAEAPKDVYNERVAMTKQMMFHTLSQLKKAAEAVKENDGS